ncbi:MAG: hypothetical protein ACKPKO_28000, partial [Candidatus Fonsibacter sp.]
NQVRDGNLERYAGCVRKMDVEHMVRRLHNKWSSIHQQWRRRVPPPPRSREKATSGSGAMSGD